jgi:TatD DNase family protein
MTPKIPEPMPGVQFFDAHCHLQDERLQPYLDAAMRRAAEAGVTALMCCGSEETDWPRVRSLAQRFPGVRASYGLHPWYVGARTPGWLDRMREFLADPAAAVGEIGLDHALDKSTHAAQEEVFLAQLDLAREFERPVSVHCRRAWGRLMELLEARGWPAAGFVLHSYSGSAELVPSLARRGAYFSFSGAVTFVRNVRGRAALAVVPLERLLIETDAPDLRPDLPPDAPVLRDTDGKPLSEPAHLAFTASVVSALRGLSTTALAETTLRIARQLFGNA